MLGILMIGLMSFSLAHAADEKTETTIIAPVETTQNLDARINSLQSTKNCIRSAKTKSDIEDCRRTIQIKRERINVH